MIPVRAVDMMAAVLDSPVMCLFFFTSQFLCALLVPDPDAVF